MIWKNRIVGHGEESPEQLLAHPLNARTHPQSQRDALSGLLRDVGIIQSVVVNRRTGFMVDGHARVMLALQENQPAVPVVYVDLSEREEHLVLAAMDRIGSLAGIDDAVLADLLEQVQTGDPALLAMLDQMAVDAGIVPGLTPEPPGPEQEPGAPSLATCPRCGHEF